MTAMRKMLKTALWPVLPKPWHAPTMETRFGLWSGVSALYSQSGRQLGEANARPFMLSHGIPAETIACRYEGSRHGRTINMSALRVAMANFDAALAITGAVRRFHLDRAGGHDRPGLWDLFIIARGSIALIAYRHRARRQGQVDPRVPDALASQYQFISGIFMICRDMMMKGEDIIAQNSPVSAQMLYDHADANGIFLSPNGMACAGSTRKIMDFMQFCLEGEGGAGEEGAGAANPLDLASIVAVPDDWYRYALATVELDCFIEVERLRGTSHPTGVRPSGIHAAVANYCRSLPGGPDVPPGTSFADGILARQNAILHLLGWPAVARIPHRHLAERLGRPG